MIWCTALTLAFYVAAWVLVPPPRPTSGFMPDLAPIVLGILYFFIATIASLVTWLVWALWT